MPILNKIDDDRNISLRSENFVFSDKYLRQLTNGANSSKVKVQKLLSFYV
jgi:hypothetical protein